MVRRFIGLYDCNDALIKEIDITDLAHANYNAHMTMRVTQLCDMGHWHKLSEWDIPPWGDSLKDPF